MPTHKWSLTILGEFWPTTSTVAWQAAGEAHHHKGMEYSESAQVMRSLAGEVVASNDGRFADALHEQYWDNAIFLERLAEFEFACERVCQQVIDLVEGAQDQMARIDAEADQEIDAITEGAKGTPAMVTVPARIAQVVAQAKARVAAISVKTVAGLSGLALPQAPADPAKSTPSAPTNPTDNTVKPVDYTTRPQDFAPKQDLPGGGDKPQRPSLKPGDEGPKTPEKPLPDDGHEPTDGKPGTGDPASPHDPTHGNPREPQGTPTDPGTPGPAAPHTPQTTGTPQGFPSLPANPMGSPGRGPSGSPGMPSMPSMPSSGLPGMPKGSPGNPGLGGPAMPGTSSPAALSPVRDFTRGFNAGLTSPAPASYLPPPTTSGAGPAAPSVPTGVASPTAGSVTHAAAPSSAAPGAPMMAAPVAAGSTGLVPYGSDLTRAASGTPPVATPPAPAVTAPAAGPAGPVLPPGVAASQVGSAAAGAMAGTHSDGPDPLLEAAKALVFELMHASGTYGALDWCVGMFRTPHGVDTVVVSSEGLGYIPAGVFLPRSARMLFADPDLPPNFGPTWFARANPAVTMLAYGRLLQTVDPHIVLHALAVSANNGGSAEAARAAGILHFADCPAANSPIPREAPSATLDSAHVHRLQVVDPARWVHLNTATVPADQVRDVLWSTTHEAVTTAIERARGLFGMNVDPILPEVLDLLDAGAMPTTSQWAELDMARINAVGDSSVQRAAGEAGSVATPYARAYHNLARAASLLQWWQGGDPMFYEIAYEALQIMNTAASGPRDDEG